MAAQEKTGNVTGLLVDRHIEANRGDQNALIYGEKRYSYNDVAALTNRAGNMFLELGAELGRHIVIALPPSPAFLASVLGAMKIGAVPTIVAKAASRELGPCVEAADPVVVVVDQAQIDNAEAAQIAQALLVVVGEDVGQNRSFVELIREAPSSLNAAHLDIEATAVAVFVDGHTTTLSHGELQAVVSGAQSPDAVSANWPLLTILTALAGEGAVSIEPQFG